ncbi:MAG: hypothetical protein MOGMAGMI_02501 [Candidatus Omnitrophica bacterium]|nr:hypothetical protein [Candidatus Omnitrophota bacterium]
MATYLHYIGGKYTPRKFIAESKRVGFITRRAPANQVKAMHFKDTVILLDWRKGKPAAFGEFIVTGVVFDGELNAKLIEELKAEDKIVEDNTGGGSVTVDRECGSFSMGGGAGVREDVDIPEIMEKAEKIQAEQQDAVGLGKESRGTVWCMVMGVLTKEYFPPRTLDPVPPFTRGFMQMLEGTTFIAAHGDEIPHDAPASQVVGVENYERAWE